MRDALANRTGLARRLTEEQALEAMTSLDRCVEMGVTLTQVVDAFARTHAAAKKSLPLAGLLAEFLAAKQREGGRGSGARHIRPYIAICAFAGLRPDHAKRVRWEQIHLERAEIEIPAGEDKTDVERIPPIQPNLAAWLRAHPDHQGRLHWSRAEFRAAWQAIGLKRWPQDCLRHNYGTYRVKLTGNMPLVALEMGNSVEVIKARYYRSVPQAEAESYFNIFPKE